MISQEAYLYVAGIAAVIVRDVLKHYGLYISDCSAAKCVNYMPPVAEDIKSAVSV